MEQLSFIVDDIVCLKRKFKNKRNGLCVATEYTPEDPKDLKEPRYFYDNYIDLLKDVEVNKKIKIGTPITYTGKIGNVKYQNKTTCYGRIRLSKILDADIDKIGIFDDPLNPIHAKEAGKLSGYLNGFPEDGVEKRLAIQKFALKAVTLAGVVTFDFKTLYTNTDTELYKEICKVADSKELTDQQKLAILTEKFAKYEKEVQSSYPVELKKELDRAGRVKMTSIAAMGMPQLIVTGSDGKPVITRGSLLTGYGEKDMIYHFSKSDIKTF